MDNLDLDHLEKMVKNIQSMLPVYTSQEDTLLLHDVLHTTVADLMSDEVTPFDSYLVTALNKFPELLALLRSTEKELNELSSSRPEFVDSLYDILEEHSKDSDGKFLAGDPIRCKLVESILKLTSPLWIEKNRLAKKVVQLEALRFAETTRANIATSAHILTEKEVTRLRNAVHADVIADAHYCEQHEMMYQCGHDAAPKCPHCKVTELEEKIAQMSKDNVPKSEYVLVSTSEGWRTSYEVHKINHPEVKQVVANCHTLQGALAVMRLFHL